METTIKKIGNSAGILLPAVLMRSLNLSVCQSVNIETVEGNLIVKPQSTKRYTLKELLTQCDEQTPMPADIGSWVDMQQVGLENND